MFFRFIFSKFRYLNKLALIAFGASLVSNFFLLSLVLLALAFLSDFLYYKSLQTADR